MRVGGSRNFNASLSAPGYGEFRLVVTTLGHGMKVIANQGESRNQRTLYPYARTSGAWYVETQHGNPEERDELSRWLLTYIKRVSSPWVDNAPRPITLTVPSRDFVKLGYPTSSIEFGDEATAFSWPMLVGFSSASDPTSSALSASRYIPMSGATGTNPGDSNLSSAQIAPLSPVAVATGESTYGGGSIPSIQRAVEAGQPARANPDWQDDGYGWNGGSSTRSTIFGRTIPSGGGGTTGITGAQ